MAVKGGSARDRIYDGVQGYIVGLAVVAVLFGGQLALDLGHVIVQAFSTAIGSLVREVPAGADTVKRIQGGAPQITVPAPRTMPQARTTPPKPKA